MLKTLLAVVFALLCSYRSFCSPPELWTVSIDHEIPSHSPDGSKINSLAFVVRMRGTDDNKLYRAMNLYDSLRFQLFDATNRPIKGGFYSNTGFLPQHANIFGLAKNAASNDCYTICLNGNILEIPLKAGGLWQFKGISKGKMRLVITFDDTSPSSIVRDFENRYDGGNGGIFYRGPQACGEIEFEVTSLEEAAK